MAGTFEIYRDKASQFRFRLKAGNGEVVLSSEGYKAKASAQNGIESVKKNCGNDICFERVETASGNFRFNLKARNHQVIGTSQNYSTASSRDNGIQAVARAAKGARTNDTTRA